MKVYSITLTTWPFMDFYDQKGFFSSKEDLSGKYEEGDDISHLEPLLRSLGMYIDSDEWTILITPISITETGL